MLELALALGALALGTAKAVGDRHRRRVRGYLDERFERLDELGAYREGLPVRHWPGPRAGHAVLLLHGYSASPATFEALQEALRARGVPFAAPTLTGFGLTDMHLLERARLADWQRDALMAYDDLAAVAERVSVVGMSFGTLLAAFVAERRPVHEMVWVAPYFFLKQPKEQGYKRLLATRLGRAVFTALLPMAAKPAKPGRVTNVDIVDPERARGVFHYPALPLHSVSEVWQAQDVPRSFDAGRWRRLTIVYGEQDLTIDAPALLEALDRAGLPYDRWTYPRSGHGLLHDHDREEAAAAIADRLAEASREADGAREVTHG